MSGTRGVPGRRCVVAAAALLVAGGCGDLLIQDPAPASPAGIMLSYSIAPSSLNGDGMGSAFAKTDGVFVRIVRDGSQEVVLEELIPVQPGGGEIQVRLELMVSASAERFSVSAELRSGQDALFRGSSAVELRAGSSSPAEVPLTPVPAGIVLPSSPPALTWIGETTPLLGGAVVFATGDPIPGLALVWTSLDPAVATVSLDGEVTALAEGTARIRGEFDDFEGTVLVEVRPEPASVEVQPSTASLVEGRSIRLTAAVLDAGGTPLERPVTWSSLNTRVASVDQEGLVRALAAGTATIRAALDDPELHGDAVVTVSRLIQPPVDFEISDTSGTYVILTWRYPYEVSGTLRFELDRRLSSSTSWVDVSSSVFYQYAPSYEAIDEVPGSGTYQWRLRACVGSDCSAYRTVSETILPSEMD